MSMATINKVFLTGRLARDPEYKEVKPGIEACRLVLTTSWENKRQDKQEVCYIDCTVWSAEARLCRDHLKKGNIVSLEGRLKLETWVDKQSGNQRSKHVVVADTITFLEKMMTFMPSETDRQQPLVRTPVSKPQSQQAPPTEENYDELPF